MNLKTIIKYVRLYFSEVIYIKETKTDFSGLIQMINGVMNQNEPTGIAVKKRHSKFYYGELLEGFLVDRVELNVLDEENFCQDLYDSLVLEYGEELCPSYEHGFCGEYTYFMALGENILIFFPEDNEYQNWIYNQVQKDNEKSTRKTK